MTAAPRVSGPAHAPRPTSSIPTTTSCPSSHSARSTAIDGALRFSADRSFGAVAAPIDGEGTSAHDDARHPVVDPADVDEADAGGDEVGHGCGVDGGEQAAGGLGVVDDGVDGDADAGL